LCPAEFLLLHLEFDLVYSELVQNRCEVVGLGSVAAERVKPLLSLLTESGIFRAGLVGSHRLSLPPRRFDRRRDLNRVRSRRTPLRPAAYSLRRIFYPNMYEYHVSAHTPPRAADSQRTRLGGRRMRCAAVSASVVPL